MGPKIMTTSSALFVGYSHVATLKASRSGPKDNDTLDGRELEERGMEE